MIESCVHKKQTRWRIFVEIIRQRPNIGHAELGVGILAFAFSVLCRDMQLFFTGAGLVLVGVRTLEKARTTQL